jgi:transcriptional regulator GlxA family with amidase domain
MPSISANSDVSPLTIAFVLFDRTKLLDVVGPLQVFNDARLPTGDKAYRVILLSHLGGSVVTDTGFELFTDSFESCSDVKIDTLIVSGGDSALEAAHSTQLHAFFEQTKNRCRRLCSVCMGAFILAEGGHLNGRRATTYWENCGELGLRYPEIRVQSDSLFEIDGKIWTSAGVTAGIDMALAMVENDISRAEALRLAQSLVLYVRRTGGQKQFSAMLVRQVQSKGALFDLLIAKILSDLTADLSVTNLALMSNMSERTFARKFTHITKVTPARFIEELRVEAACQLISAENLDLSRVITLCGFASPEHMRRAFQRIKGIAPSEYKARFGR